MTEVSAHQLWTEPGWSDPVWRDVVPHFHHMSAQELQRFNAAGAWGCAVMGRACMQHAGGACLRSQWPAYLTCTVRQWSPKRSGVWPALEPRAASCRPSHCAGTGLVSLQLRLGRCPGAPRGVWVLLQDPAMLNEGMYACIIAFSHAHPLKKKCPMEGAMCFTIYTSLTAQD